MARVTFDTSEKLANLARRETSKVYENSSAKFKKRFQVEIDYEARKALIGVSSKSQRIEIQKRVCQEFGDLHAETIYLMFPQMVFLYGRAEEHSGKVNLYHPAISLWIASDKQIATYHKHNPHVAAKQFATNWVTTNDKGELVMHPSRIPKEVVKHGESLACVQHKLKLEAQASGTPTNLAAKKGEKTYTIKKGDTLWGIAEKHYGSGFKWRKIAEANPDKIKYLPNEVVHIYPGDELVIPEVDLSEEKNKALPESAPTKADKQANQPAIEKEKEQFQWNWNEHVFIFKGQKSLQQVVDYFNDLMKLKKEKKITVKQVTEHDGKVYFPLKTMDTLEEHERQMLIIYTLAIFGLDKTQKFFERGRGHDATTWKIDPKSEEGQWILNSTTYKAEKNVIKRKIREKIKKGEDLSEEFKFNKGADLQLFGAFGTMHWKATLNPITGIYDLILWDDFDFEAATHRTGIAEALTTLAREGDFTPFRTELRTTLDINQ
ncbi:MAG: LysM peptidoglycan-binding domain-containing protein [SAR324 cluster bacterium]|nr:LysM peptidoglycan-binding domain-containing protein [SAR324 cluster bacterium]